MNSALVPCILSSVNVKSTRVLYLSCDHPDLTWEHVNNIPSCPQTSITKGPQYAVTRNFTGSIQACMDFRHCISPYYFIDQAVSCCMGLLKKTAVDFRLYGNRRRRLFRFIKRMNQNLVCLYFNHPYSLPRTLLSLPEGFKELTQRGPRERETRFSQFTLQPPGDLIYISHLLAHAVLTLDNGAPTIFSGWDAATTTNQQIVIRTLHEHTFGVRRGNWRQILREKVLSAVRESVFSPATGPQESMERLGKH